MKTWAILLLLAPFVSSQATFLPEDNENITIENKKYSQFKCFNYLISPNDSEEYNMSKTFQLACRQMGRTEGYVRSKRFIQRFLDLLKMPQPEPEKIIGSKMTYEEMYRRASRLNNIIKKKKIEKMSLKEFKLLTEWDASQMVSYFGYPEGKESDAWVAMVEKNIRCDSDADIVLNICGRVNRDRRFGIKKYVVPLARFDETGLIVKYLETPKVVAVIDGNMTDIKSCQQLDTYSECLAETDSKCTSSSLNNCDFTLKIVEDKVFIRHFGEWSVVAAHYDNYTTFINGTYATYSLDISKHVVLRLPNTSWARFGDVKVYGHATGNFDHFTVHAKVDVAPIDNDDIRALEDQYTNGAISSIGHEILTKMRHNSQMNDLFYFTIFLVVLVLVIAIVLPINLYFIKKRAREARKAAKVIYTDDNCQIVM